MTTARYDTSSTRRSRRNLLGAMLATLVAPAIAPFAAPCAFAADPPPDPEKEKVRKKYETLIQFFGEEDTGRYSVRIFDADVKETASFVFLSVWKYDRDQKSWVKLDDKPQRARIVLPKDKPADSPPDSQLLANLPITQKDVGVFFVKWTVEGVEGSTFTRLGPRARGDQPAVKAKANEMVTDVPIDLNKAERIAIPNPYVVLKGK
jgi:hypothetical protein